MFAIMHPSNPEVDMSPGQWRSVAVVRVRSSERLPLTIILVKERRCVYPNEATGRVQLNFSASLPKQRSAPYNIGVRNYQLYNCVTGKSSVGPSNFPVIASAPRPVRHLTD